MPDVESPPMATHQIEQRLHVSDAHKLSLARLQAVFARACSSLGPLVRETRCWNRVALHHLAYRRLRAEFPELGSQMACNAIYSVSRSARAVYQNPNSPWHLEKLGGRELPLLSFADTAPVYFDRHTLSFRDGRLSMFTLDGRIKFDVSLSEEEQLLFEFSKLKEVVLSRNAGEYYLRFYFGEAAGGDENRSDLPEYVFVAESENAAVAALDA